MARPVAMSQIFKLPLLLPLTSSSPSGLKATPYTGLLWPRSVIKSWPVRMSQTLTVASPSPDARRLPSGWKATLCTGPAWPWKTWRGLPVAASRIFTVWSQLADASKRPSGLKARLGIICPSAGVRTSSRPVAVSQMQDRAVGGGQGQAGAVGAEHQAVRGARAPQGADQVAGFGVPDADFAGMGIVIGGMAADDRGDDAGRRGERPRRRRCPRGRGAG